MKTLTSLRVLALATVLLCGVASSSADAAIVSYDAGSRTFKYSAVNNEDNELTMAKEATNKKLVIEDTGANIVGTDRCVRPHPDNWHRVVCNVQQARRFKVSLGNLDDHAEIKFHSAISRVTVYGGSGKDELFVQGAQRTFLNGDSGADSLWDADAIGQLDGGSGGDVMLAGSGQDHLIGGSGVDYFYGQGDNDLITATEPYGVTDGKIDCGSGFDTTELDAADAAVVANCETPAPAPSPAPRRG